MENQPLNPTRTHHMETTSLTAAASFRQNNAHVEYINGWRNEILTSSPMGVGAVNVPNEYNATIWEFPDGSFMTITSDSAGFGQIFIS